MDYRHCIYRLPGHREDEVAATLWRLGALGFEVKDDPDSVQVRIEAYFPDDHQIAQAVDAWHDDQVERLHDSQLAEQDWLADYRAGCRPFAVGERFFVAPGEPDDPVPDPPDGRILLRAPAQNAFGTGSHESTRLAMIWLERLDLVGKSLLDVGTGSGILAFAALKLGAGQVVGFDLDPPSVVTATINAGHNQCRPKLFAGTAAALAENPRFDLLLVNVLPERVFPHYPRLLAGLKAGGHVVSSGNLLSRRQELIHAFEGLGLRLMDEQSEGEWTSFLLAS